jgi:hypothetical protein
MTSDRLKSILQNRWNYAKYISNRSNSNIDIDIRANLKTFTDNQFTTLYSEADVDSVDATLMLEFYKDNGYGDLMIGYKCLKALREELPPNIDIVVVSATPEDVKQIGQKYMDRYEIPLLDVQDVTDYLDSVDISKTYLITFALESEICDDDLNRLKPRTLYIDEYNGWRAPKMDSESESPFEITMIPGFGVGQDGSIRSGINIMRECIDIVPKFPKEYYFGYISEYHTETETLYKYLMYIILLNRNSMKKINIVLLIPQANLNEIQDSLNYGLEIDSAEVESKKESKISLPESLLDLDIHFQLKKTFNRTIIEDEKNHIKIYIESYLPHEDVISYMQGSQEPILVTGDQSMSEAISLGKLFFYEMQEWKRELYDNFREYCRFVLPRNTTLHYFMDKTSRVDTLETGQMDRVIEDLVKKTRHYDLSGYMRTVSSEIKQNMNLMLDIVSAIKRMMIGNEKTDRKFKARVRRIIDPLYCESAPIVYRKRRRSIGSSGSEVPAKRKKINNYSNNFCIIV